jgi:predicted phosphodiesterase
LEEVLSEDKPKKQSLKDLALLSERAKKFDTNATKSDVVADLRDVARNHPDVFVSRNFYRVNGKYSEKTWNQFFGTMEEFRSEAGLQLSRHQRQLEKYIAKHAALDQFRNFYTEEVEPWVGKHEKPSVKDGIKKIAIASDFHDLETDLFCLSVFVKTCEREQPDIIVLNGDIFDQYEFSRFDRDPRKMDIRKRFEFVRDYIFTPLRTVCPNAQIDLTIGNHEQRILKLLSSRTPEMIALMDLAGITLAQLLQLDQFEINLVSKMDLAAYTMPEIRNEIKRNFKVYYNTLAVNHVGEEDFGMCTITGHHHTPKLSTRVLQKSGSIWHLALGCMCKKDADYAQTKMGWQQSFAICHVDANAEQAVVNHVMFNDDFVVVNGFIYYRNHEESEMRSVSKEVSRIKKHEAKAFAEKEQ